MQVIPAVIGETTMQNKISEFGQLLCCQFKENSDDCSWTIWVFPFKIVHCDLWRCLLNLSKCIFHVTSAYCCVEVLFFSKYNINICICLVKLRHSYHIFICTILETLFRMDVSSNVKLGMQIITICVHFSNLSSFDWSREFTLLIFIQIWMWQDFF